MRAYLLTNQPGTWRRLPLAPFGKRLGAEEKNLPLDVGVEPDDHGFAVDLGIRKRLVAVRGSNDQGFSTGTWSRLGQGNGDDQVLALYFNLHDLVLHLSRC